MALLFMDSFDHYASADLLEKYTLGGVVIGNNTIGVVAASGRRSSAGLRWVTGVNTQIGAYVSKSLAPAGATVILGFALRVSASNPATAGLTLAQVRDSANGIQVSLRLNPTMTVSVVRGSISGGTVLGTTTATFPTNSFTHVAWQTLIDNAAGTTDLYFDGVNVLSLTAQDTQNTALASWARFSLAQEEGLNNTNVNPGRTLDYDDLYVLDGTGPAPWNAPLGDCRVDARLPTAPGATTGWTPLAGANWAAVDDAAPDDDTTYTEAAAAGATDTFVYPDAPVPGATLYGIQHCLAAKKTDAGVATIAPVVRVGGVNYPGAAINSSTAYLYHLQIAAVNPATSAQWTEAAFNAAEFGYTRTA